MVDGAVPGHDALEVTRTSRRHCDRLRPACAGITVDTCLYRPAATSTPPSSNVTGRCHRPGPAGPGARRAAGRRWRTALVGLVVVPLSLALATLVLSWSGVRHRRDGAGRPGGRRRRPGRRRGRRALLSGSPTGGRRRGRAGRPAGRRRGGLAVQLRGAPRRRHGGRRAGGRARAAAGRRDRGAASAARPRLRRGDPRLDRGRADRHARADAAAAGRPVAAPRESPLARALGQAPAAALRRVVGRPAGVAAAAGVLVLAGLAVLPALRHQPVAPPLQDRDVLISWEGAPGTSLPEMTRLTGRAGRELRAIPGVAQRRRPRRPRVAVRPDRGRPTPRSCGSASTPGPTTAPPSTPSPRSPRATPACTRTCTTYPDAAAAARPGPARTPRWWSASTAATTPSCSAKAAEVAGLARRRRRGRTSRGCRSPEYEPTVEVEVDLAKAAAVGLKPGDARRAAAIMALRHHRRPHVRGPEDLRGDGLGRPAATRHSLSSIQDLLIDSPEGRPGAPRRRGHVRVRPSPTNIGHDAVARYLDVTADVRAAASAT